MFPVVKKPNRIVQEEEFVFGVLGLEHDHIYGMCVGLIEAGAQLKWVYDPDSRKVKEFCKRFPMALKARSEHEILQDVKVHMVAGAAVPSERCSLGLLVMEHDKDYFTAKPPLTTLEQLELARAKVSETGKKYAVFYNERLGVESAVYAGYLLEQDAIGRVIHVMGTGPHRLRIETRPHWFFKKEEAGGILCDLGCHQIEQFLFYTGCKDAQVLHSKVANYNHPKHEEFEDFGDATLLGDNGATNYFRVDWFTPVGLGNWGDGRIQIVGTEGYIEIRKYIDVARNRSGDHLFLVNAKDEYYFSLEGKVGLPFFGQLIEDCLRRTEIAMTQEHAFKVAELSLIAQEQAFRVEG